jgi:SAM-dependent methyltransferase
MLNPLSNFVERHLGAKRLKQFAFGLAADFWKDGDANPFAFGSSREGFSSHTSPPVRSPASRAEQKKKAQQKVWHAAPGEISEKMFGTGYVTPGDAVITEAMIRPLGLTGAMNVLDLSAGLGGRMRKTTEETGAYVTGLEPDKEIALRGMELSIKAGKGKHAPVAHYDPVLFTVSRMYDCVLARETFYRVTDKDAFFKSISACVKAKGQLVFTDYIINPEHRKEPAIVAWQVQEKNASPLGLVEMAEAWAKVDFGLRINEDMSDFYKQEVLTGLKRLAIFLSSSNPPDPETKKSLQRRIEIWTHRLASMEQGMKFYRFYGTKK